MNDRRPSFRLTAINVMSIDRKYYSPSEVADMMGISEQTVRRWARNEDIPHRRIGQQIRIPAEWVEADTDEEAANVSA